uniref:Uncharacterized protein n=1 Tax=Magnetococcus massalia (strain MO-1) TaxID=451514 RepID=A0A1S7LK74_MAGMO|nr:protein of unknown function [Candidatus Magnetococcus massalia]
MKIQPLHNTHKSNGLIYLNVTYVSLEYILAYFRTSDFYVSHLVPLLVERTCHVDRSSCSGAETTGACQRLCALC